MILRLREYGESVMRSLQADDVRLSKAVHVTFRDGSTTTIANAYPEMAGDWLYVFSATDGFFLYARPNVIHWEQSGVEATTMLGKRPVVQGMARAAA